MSDKISYVTFKFILALGLALLVLVSGCSTTPIIQSNQGPAVYPHIMVIGLDGVSYSTFKKLQDGGHFRDFNPVSPMVASFPSISDPNWSLLMNVGPEPGYTKAFFDPTIKTSTGFGEESGSILSHVTKEPAYERAMDFKVDGAFEHATTLIWTKTMAKYLLESLERDFLKSQGRETYFSLIINTDLVSHTEGEEALTEYLIGVERAVTRIEHKYAKLHGSNNQLEVVILSDHGNAYFSPQDVPFISSLEQQGWTLESTITGSRSVGFFVPEMLSFGAFYCESPSRRDLALSLARTDNIQSTMYVEDSGDITILSAKGQSENRFHYDEVGENLSYWQVSGTIDPYDQMKFFKNKSMTKNKYFDLTLKEKYPNALVRIWEGFNTNSRTKPSVLANPELGYVFGNKTLRILTTLKGFASSHGSLHRDETLGIFVSNKRVFPPVRPQDVRRFLHVEELHANVR